MASRVVCPQCRRYRWIPRAQEPYCTPSCARQAAAGTAPPVLAPVWVFCCVCGQAHDARRVPATAHWHSEGRKWWCADEVACIMRATINEQSAQEWMADTAAIQAALTSVWASLDADGWKL